jgi:aromatase
MNRRDGHDPAAYETQQHTIIVDAPAQVVYGIIADAPSWPVRFAPTVHVERTERSPGSERLRIRALAGDQVKAWTSHRELDPVGLLITFRQEVSQPPIASMAGQWLMEPLPGDRTRVVLSHSFRAVNDDPQDLAWIREVTDRNSTSELAGLKSVAEGLAGRDDDTEFSFEDTVVVRGSAADIYAFINDAREWADRLPHVSRMDLREDEPGVQVMEMDTVAPNGSVHTTKSVRVCFTDERILYKQTVVPALMAAHTGEWRVVPVDDGVAVSSRHTVVLRPESVTSVLGPDATLADARRFAHNALSTNSGITLRHAKEFAEERATV